MRNSRHPRHAVRLAIATAALVPLLAGALVTGSAHAFAPEEPPVDTPVVEPAPDTAEVGAAVGSDVADPTDSASPPESPSVPDTEPTPESLSAPDPEPVSATEPAPEHEARTLEPAPDGAVKAATPVLAPGQSYVVNRTFTGAHRIDIAIIGPAGQKLIELVTPSGALGSTSGAGEVLEHHLETGSPLPDGSYRILIHNLSDQPMTIEYEIAARSLGYLFRPEPPRPSAGLFVATEALYATEPLSGGAAATVRAVGADGAEYTATLRRDAGSPERWTAFLGNVVGAFLVHAEFTIGGRVHDVVWTTTIHELDGTLPVVEYLTDPAASNSRGWFARPVTVTLRGSDSGSGVDRLEWRLNGGAEQSVAGNVATISLADGRHTLEFRAIDAAGNATNWAVRQPSIDTVAPTVDAIAPAPGAEYTVGEEVRVGFDCADALSGVHECVGPQAPGTVLPTDTEGEFSFEIVATDRAGNLHREVVEYRVVDPGLPIVELVLPSAEGADGWYLEAPELELVGSSTAVEIHWTDTVDGVEVSGSVAGSSATITPDREGTHELRYWAVDALGRTGEPAYAEFRLDASDPVIDVRSPVARSTARALAPGQVLLGAALEADFACDDLVSGIVECVGSTPDGERLPTGVLGTHSFTVRATDAAGRSAERVVTYEVVSASAAEDPRRPALAVTGVETAALGAVALLLLTAGGVAVLVTRRRAARG